MRTLAFLALASAVAGCGSTPGNDASAADAAGSRRIECRLAGTAAFERICTLDLLGSELIVRKPDGGFRRLTLINGGRGIAAADGAEPARVTILSVNQVQVDIGGDSYRLSIRLLP